MKGQTEFSLAVHKLFTNWDILHHAVESHFGGQHSREKSEWLPNVVVDFFIHNRDLEPHELEAFIGEIMDNEFNLFVEDGSVKRLSRQLCRAFGLARDERHEELKDFIQSIQPLPENCTMKKAEESEEDEEKGDEAMDIDEPPLGDNVEKPKKQGPVVDEDGFTLVVGKKKR